MKKSTYYQTIYKRNTVIKDTLLGFALGISSWPRMLLEVPIRRNFGERYFRFSTAVIIAIVLAIVPFFLVDKFPSYYNDSAVSPLISRFLTWYLYLGVFMYHAFQRRAEIKRLPGVFDFARFSLSTGLIHERFLNFTFNGKRLKVRTIETVLEPGFYFGIGYVLSIMGQPIGLIFCLASICYSFSYVAAYHAGDNFIMDKIDIFICSQELAKTFTDDADSSNSRGFRFYGHRPADPETRRDLADMFLAPEETAEPF